VNVETILLHCLGRKEFIARAVAADPAADAAALTARWRAARDTMRRLRASEPGCADQAGVLPIPPTMSAHVGKVVASSQVEAAFSSVPVAFGLVDSQALIPSGDSLWSARLAQWRQVLHGRAGDDGVLARTCLPLAKARALPPPLVHVARVGGRLLLLDGHHRVRALASMGVRYVPSIISACDHVDDVRGLLPGLEGRNLRQRLAGPRPPLLRDHLRRSLVYAHRAA
jgi:hypothetical protein